jgi:putative ABC transport system permease protein
LTILGIVVGVAAVVALISIGDGMQNSIEEQFESLGYNTIILSPGGSTEQASGPEGRMGVLKAIFGSGKPAVVDLSILGRLPQVVSFGAQRIETGMIASENLDGQAFLRITGLTYEVTDYFNAYFNEFPIEQGRNFDRSDRSVIVLGAQVAADLGMAVGDQVQIETTGFEVIGILESPEKTKGGAMTFRGMDTGLFVPIESLETLYGGEGKISQALVEVTDQTDVVEASQAIKTLFSQLGTPVQTITAEEMSQQIKSAMSSIQMTLTAIAAISLLVGAIGVMNTMFTSVLERTREIGIMKAIGAKDRHVLSLFLIESGLLGIIGGAIGVLAGVAISSLAGGILSGALTQGRGSEGMAFAASYSPWLIIGALLLSFVLGAIAGVLPARRGAKLRPVEALRYE